MKNKSLLSIEKIQNEKNCLIIKSNDLQSSFEAYLNINLESIYKNRLRNYKFTSNS